MVLAFDVIGLLALITNSNSTYYLVLAVLLAMAAATSPALQRLLHGLILASFVVFTFANSVLFTSWWQHTDLWKQLLDSLTVPYSPGLEYAAPLVKGAQTAQVLLTWGSTLVAAIATAVLVSIRKPAWQQPPSTLALKVRYVLNWQLYPHPFWGWWCGGLSVLDGLLVAAWFALHFMWVQRKYLKETKGVDPGDWEDKVEGAAVSFGWVSVLDLLLVFFPVPRSSFLQWLFGQQFPAIIKYHRWLGNGLILVVCTHGFMFYGLWVKQGRWTEEALDWDPYSGVNRMAGGIAVCTACLIWVTSREFVRRRFYQMFYKTHIAGFLVFISFAFLHWRRLWVYCLPGLLLYAVDVAFKLCQHAVDTSVLRVAKVAADRSLVTVCLELAESANAEPGQIVWIRVPGVAALDWHPATIASVSPAKGKTVTATVHMKVLGTWTKELMKWLNNHHHSVKSIQVAGPYHSTIADNLSRYESVVLIAGGVGVTPILAALHTLQSKPDDSRPYQVHVIWTARSQTDFCLLDDCLFDQCRGPKGWLDVQLYYTGPRPGSCNAPTPTQHDMGCMPDAELSEDTVTVPLLLSEASSSSADALPALDAGNRYAHKPLVGQSPGPWMWSAVVLVSMVAALCSLYPVALVQYQQAYLGREGGIYAVMGLLQALPLLTAFLAASAILLPWFLIQKARSPALHCIPLPSPSHASLQFGEVEVTLTGSESNACFPIMYQRPDLYQLLSGICACEGAAQDIGVFVSGPETLMAAAHSAVVSLNSRTHHRLHFHKESFCL